VRVATITISISGENHGGAPIGGCLSAGMPLRRAPAPSAIDVAADGQPAAGERRARFRPIKPQPMMAMLRGMRGPPVRITDLCDVSLILPPT